MIIIVTLKKNYVKFTSHSDYILLSLSRKTVSLRRILEAWLFLIKLFESQDFLSFEIIYELVKINNQWFLESNFPNRVAVKVLFILRHETTCFFSWFKTLWFWLSWETARNMLEFLLDSADTQPWRNLIGLQRWNIFLAEK